MRDPSYEGERTIAFMDIAPGTRGHLLVIPREHSTDLWEIAPEDLAATALASQRPQRRARTPGGTGNPDPARPDPRQRD